MAGAIGAPLGRLEPAIGEIPAPRIAERPSAGEFANVLEPHPSHLPDLGFGESPSRPFSPVQERRAGTEFCSPSTVRGAEEPQWRADTLRPASRRAQSAPVAVEPDPDPVRLADHGVAGRRAERRGDDARASSFERQPFENLDRLVCPQHVRPPWLPPRHLQPQDGMVLVRQAILLSAVAWTPRPPAIRLFTKNIQLFQ